MGIDEKEYQPSDMNRIDIKYGSLFPWPFQFIAAIILIMALLLIVETPLVGGVLIIVSGFILSGYEGTIIDKASKCYQEYKSFLFIKTGEKIKYQAIEKIFINTSKMRQQFYTAHTTKSSIFENLEFNGFLKFENGTKIQLLRKSKKADLTKQLKEIAAFLQVPLEDNTPVKP